MALCVAIVVVGSGCQAAVRDDDAVPNPSPTPTVTYAPDFTHPYQYALDPERDREEWVSGMSDGSLDAALQIPPETIESMSTGDLIDAVLDYPFLIDLYAFNTRQEGFSVVRSRHHAIDALLERADSAVALVDRYRALDLKAVAESNEDRADLQVYFLEILLAQPSVLARLDEPKRRELVADVYTKMTLKIDQFGGVYYELGSALLLAGRAVLLDDMTFLRQAPRGLGLGGFLLTGSHRGATMEQARLVAETISSAVHSTYGIADPGFSRLPPEVSPLM